MINNLDDIKYVLENNADDNSSVLDVSSLYEISNFLDLKCKLEEDIPFIKDNIKEGEVGILKSTANSDFTYSTLKNKVIAIEKVLGIDISNSSNVISKLPYNKTIDITKLEKMYSGSHLFTEGWSSISSRLDKIESKLIDIENSIQNIINNKI